MRTIKFRGICEETNEMVYGDLTHNSLGEPLISYYVTTPPSSFNPGGDTIREYARVKPETVGQFTGLFDKNGKEIYKGDLVKINHGDPFAPLTICVVVEEKGAFGVLPIDNQTDIFGNKYTGRMLPFYPDYTPLTTEVIGNIYENPELLNTPLQ